MIRNEIHLAQPEGFSGDEIEQWEKEYENIKLEMNQFIQAHMFE